MLRKNSLDSIDTSSIGTPSLQPTISRQRIDHYDYLAKIILVGPSGCGKSSLFHRFMKGGWNTLTSQTIGVEFSSKILSLGPSNVDNVKMKMQLWDTAGQERFRSLTRGYYRGSAGVILVYDVMDKKSFAMMREFMIDIKNLTESTVSIVLVANKCDLLDSPEVNPDELVTKEEALEFCLEYSRELATEIPLVYASALKNVNVTESFEKLGYSVLTKVELGTLDPENVNSGVQYGDFPFYSEVGNSSVLTVSTDHRKRALAALRKKQSLTLSLNLSEDEERTGWTCCGW
ncbi:unnamed protein product [Kuraishia capsulata CBS 1993]|uniref:GTP-binding protein n=1 Tax=Kuraishia capsulata CBS 1993 TaxID=1382522 RepID=W6MLK2_9ASCO|nr:uncharacterized protein KUCA_T00001682001 [Kuraishia capsulata CBS 1993]CDK25712.1 unnamed protein product [Kuraishia capsulata CBS 1993]